MTDVARDAVNNVRLRTQSIKPVEIEPMPLLRANPAYLANGEPESCGEVGDDELGSFAADDDDSASAQISRRRLVSFPWEFLVGLDGEAQARWGRRNNSDLRDRAIPVLIRGREAN
jgi:hypothetical protein